ncbi:MAG: hypothetical protein GY854_19850 [Deltaproteobacteria bacterium]|nr:hypothetical protein [Deltaproteobacteria bacterium]
MQFGNINRNTTRQDLDRQLSNLIQPDKYWNKWKLTDLLIEPTFGTRCKQLIAGEHPNGKKMQEGGMKDEDGQPLRFRLRVATRQACTEDAKGNPINGWKYQVVEAPPGDNTIYPKRLDPPIPGDIVHVKKEQRERDPDTGEALTPGRRNAMIAKGQDVFIRVRKKVDKDLCIWCTFEEAQQLLTQKGKRLKFPEIQRRDLALDAFNPPRPQREITNWHFEEVAHNYKAPASSRRKQKTSDVSDATHREEEPGAVV